MDSSSGEVRADRVFAAGIRDPVGRWILGANACALVLLVISPWEIGEVLVAFWLEAVVVALLFAALIALAPRSGPTFLHRSARVGGWFLLAGGFLALTGSAVSWTVAAHTFAEGVLVEPRPTFIPPVAAGLAPTPGLALGWIVFRGMAAFSDILAGRNFDRGLGLAAARFFGVYLPVLAVTAGLHVLTDGALHRLLPLAFLAVLTYYELVLALNLPPMLGEGPAAPAASPQSRR